MELINKSNTANYAIRAIAILCVVIGHTPSPLSKFIYSWHMPIFFLLSGFYLKIDQDDKNFLKKSFRNLILPFGYYGLLGLGVELLKRYILGRPQVDILTQLYTLFVSCTPSEVKTYAFILWFLPTLFFARLISKQSLRLINPWGAILVSTLLASAVHFINIDLIFGVDKAFLVTPYVLAGYLISRYTHKIESTGRYTLISAIFLVLCYFFYPKLNIADKEFSFLFIPNYLFPIALYTSLLIVISRLTIPSMIVSIGKSSMFIYIFHVYTNNIGHIISTKMGLNWIVTTAISCLALYIVHQVRRTFVLSRFFPYV